MAKILLIRHGQASFFSDNYDQLSPLGQLQAEALHAYWEKIQWRLDKVYSGSLERQRHTAQIAARRHLETLPHQIMPHFNEHCGMDVVKSSGQFELPPAHLPDAEKHKQVRAFFKTFQKIMDEWVQGKIPEYAKDIETWQAFRARVREGLEEILSNAEKKETIAVFTSGGTISAAVGDILQLSNSKITELSWMVANSSITEIVQVRGRTLLRSFNTTPHLIGKKLTSMV